MTSTIQPRWRLRPHVCLIRCSPGSWQYDGAGLEFDSGPALKHIREIATPSVRALLRTGPLQDNDRKVS